MYVEAITPPATSNKFKGIGWLVVPFVLAFGMMGVYAQQQTQTACDAAIDANCVWKSVGGNYVCVNKFTGAPCPAGSCPPR